MLAVLLVPAVSIFAKEKTSAEKPKLSFTVTDCTDGGRNGMITAKLQNYDENASYLISFDSGKRFYTMNGSEKNLIHAKKGFYNILVKKMMKQYVLIYIPCMWEVTNRNFR